MDRNASLTAYEFYNDNNEVEAVWPMVHIPCQDETVGNQVVSVIEQFLTERNGTQGLKSLYSKDDGGYVCVAFQSNGRQRTKSLAEDIVDKATKIRDAHPNIDETYYEDGMHITANTFDFGKIE